ncbi:MAG: M20/M25/M40 family metallo-hydrolase [Anaerolineae bacterium]
MLLLAPGLLFAWIGALQPGTDNTLTPAPPLPPSVVGQVIRQVSTAELEAHVCHLQDKDSLGYCNTQGSRFSFNAAGLQEAADYIAGQFREHGLIASTRTFTLTDTISGEGISAVLTNVVGTLAGTAPPAERGIVIISAHYDSLTDAASTGGPAPGADDNASGVAAVLEAARLLSGRRLWHTVRFAAFAGEEQGLHGSKHFAAAARAADEHIIGVVNADMIAYDRDGEPRMEVHAGLDPPNVALAHALTDTIQAYQLDLWPQVVRNGAIRGSDHSSFWNQGFPAILVIEDTEFIGPTHDFNPYYHTPEDTLDKIDRAYLTEMVRAIIGTATRLARPVGPDLRVVQQGPAAVLPGQTVTFTLVYSNAGTTPAAGVVLTDTFSHGLTYQSDSSRLSRAFDLAGHVIWDLGELDAGTEGGFVITATVLSDLSDGMSVSSRATVAGHDLDADGADNVSKVEARVPWRAYLPLVWRSEVGE